MHLVFFPSAFCRFRVDCLITELASTLLSVLSGLSCLHADVRHSLVFQILTVTMPVVQAA